MEEKTLRDESNTLTLKWERLEETGLMNAENILGLDCYNNYYLGNLVNGELFIRDRIQRSGYRKVEIEKYAELPEADCHE